jgi:hypothetical protein
MHPGQELNSIMPPEILPAKKGSHKKEEKREKRKETNKQLEISQSSNQISSKKTTTTRQTECPSAGDFKELNETQQQQQQQQQRQRNGLLSIPSKYIGQQRWGTQHICSTHWT